MAGCPMKVFLDLENFRDGTPRAALNQLRAEHRILWEPDEYATGGHWLLFRRDDIDRVLQSPAEFTNNDGVMLEDFPADVLAEKRQSMTFMDPPRHRRYRALVEGAFRPQALVQREPMMRRFAAEILDALGDRTDCEFVTEVAIQMPMRVTFAVLGVEAKDFRYVVDLTNAITMGFDPDYAESRAAGFRASVELVEFGERLAADHRLHPRDSLTQDVLGAELEGMRLTDRDFGRFFSNLVVGGIETTRNTLSWAMVEFIRAPEQYRLLQADPAGMAPAAADEILRYRNPVVYLRRTATQEVEIAGQTIAKGDKVICLLGSPNRDPAYFERPDAFDITRPPDATRRNMRTFGSGPHFCLGMHQARMNLVVMLEEIARRIDNPRLRAEPRVARSIFMDGFKELRVEFDWRAGGAPLGA